MVEMIGLYASAIVPLAMAFAMGLDLAGRHGSGLVVRGVLLVIFLAFAVVNFVKIRHENRPTRD